MTTEFVCFRPVRYMQFSIASALLEVLSTGRDRSSGYCPNGHICSYIKLTRNEQLNETEPRTSFT
jgi:hypothetical protein